VHVLIVILHVLTCVMLIAVVLLQHGKGAEIGVQFGGGSSQTVFGARGAGNFLTKATTGAAVIFMITSLTLSRMSGGSADRVLDAPPPEPAKQAPALPQEHPTPAPGAAAPGSSAPGELQEFEVIDPSKKPAGDAESKPAPAPAPSAPAPAPAPPPGS
jgi:preprotein translocase subunit SecG